MKPKRKHATPLEGCLFLIVVLGAALLLAFVCFNSMYYQFDGAAPCTPESPACITEMAR